jgi:hypothetical protein
MSHRFSSKTYAYYKIRVRENKMSNQEWTIQRHWQHWAHKTHDEDNPETLATLGTQDTGRRQSRDTGNVGYTRHRTKTI